MNRFQKEIAEQIKRKKEFADLRAKSPDITAAHLKAAASHMGNDAYNFSS